MSSEAAAKVTLVIVPLSPATAPFCGDSLTLAESVQATARMPNAAMRIMLNFFISQVVLFLDHTAVYDVAAFPYGIYSGNKFEFSRVDMV